MATLLFPCSLFFFSVCSQKGAGIEWDLILFRISNTIHTDIARVRAPRVSPVALPGQTTDQIIPGAGVSSKSGQPAQAQRFLIRSSLSTRYLATMVAFPGPAAQCRVCILRNDSLPGRPPQNLLLDGGPSL